MSDHLIRLAQRIREECDHLERVMARAQKAWERAQHTGDDLYLDSAALNLHGFYSGVERLLQLIATTVDGSLPQGANWHQLLLLQMTEEVPHVRPAVISARTFTLLEEFRGFRHVARNIYTFQFNPERLEKLVQKLPETFASTRDELLAFADFLEESNKRG